MTDEKITVDTSKYPMMYSSSYNGIKVVGDDIVHPCYCIEDSSKIEGGVTYFMLQATGFKLKSNKELPSIN